MSWPGWIVLALAGGAGAVARFLIGRAVTEWGGGEFPYGTLLVNLSGSVALGLAVGAGLRGDGLLVLGAGALGSYTTFSAWMLESQRLGEEGEGTLLVLNLVGSIVLGLAAAALGRWLGGLG